MARNTVTPFVSVNLKQLEIYIHISVCVYVCTYIYTYMYTYMYIYMCTYMIILSFGLPWWLRQ